MTPNDDSAGAPGVRRLHDLLGMTVRTPTGRVLGHVNDLRLVADRAVRGLHAELVVDGLVVDGRHAGSLLGYDRRQEQGPWLLRLIVRALHRHAGYTPWSAVDRLDWDAREVTLHTERLQPLS